MAKFAAGVVDTGAKFDGYRWLYDLKGQCHEIFDFWFFS